MNLRKQGLRVFGISLLAALGSMTYMAGGAQATVGAEWRVLGNMVMAKAVSAELHSTSVLLLVGGTFNITIHCTAAAGEGIVIFGAGTAEGKIAFSGCTTTGAANCDPINQPIVADFKALLILHNAETYILFSPLTGAAVLAPVRFDNQCVFAPAKNVTGTLVAECGHLSAGAFVHLNCSVEEPSHLLRQAPAALFPADALLFGAKPAALDGIGKVFLTAEPTENWGGIG